MSSIISLPEEKIRILQQGRVFVPSPLALDENFKPLPAAQRLLTLYYIRSGAAAVIPGAHTGEFALDDPAIFSNWLGWVKEMTLAYGQDMILMAAVGGEAVYQQAETAARLGYDLVMVAPTAFAGKTGKEVMQMAKDLASVIPLFGFELQQAIAGAYLYDHELWEQLFQVMYGAKGASFNTYRSLVMLEAAARSDRMDHLTLLTGNDDRIVTDLNGEYYFEKGLNRKRIRYHGGLLGHWATDTHAVVHWVDHIFKARNGEGWRFPMTLQELSHAVNRCNMVLFDALGNFENSVWGVKYRLASLGLLPNTICRYEEGRKGQAEAIDNVYGMFPELTDRQFVRENLVWMKKELGINY